MIKYYNQLERMAKLILILSLAVMAIINIANVVSRYLLSTSLAYTEELVTNLFVYNTFIGASVAARKGAHLGMPIIYDRLNEKNQRWMMFGVALLSAALFLVLLRFGFTMARDQFNFGQRTPALGLPAWIFGAAIPIGGLFMAAAFLVGGYETLKGKR
ncbi:TRAP transporter small permease [Anoxynatronum buryatiense]|uniref:TRAP-type C4-dicarboxylate transport system, small permease component n=1 Tax=Anoxynatronum buryatiense TaxID=489973 RepID=A0AA45WWQ5_9CLOT|nr:TRAP transporter small permease [Anoxynatronum buryatiense]SMP60377.1 TRAP-type C4-dicarboxylate transport system, small permease component [Anoxynatronum buryatiense]